MLKNCYITGGQMGTFILGIGDEVVKMAMVNSSTPPLMKLILVNLKTAKDPDLGRSTIQIIQASSACSRLVSNQFFV
jgi:hypothetical protein